MLTKVCSGCNVAKEAADFYRSSSARDGRQGYCKSCSAERRLAWQRANPERMREHARKFVSENREHVVGYARRWLDEHRDHVNERQRRWRSEHPGKTALYVQRWRDSHPDTVHAMQARRRHAQPGTPFTRSEIIERDQRRCHMCGKRCALGEIHIDHLVPLALGGLHGAENVAVACADCNLRSGPGRLAAQLRLI